MTRRGGNRTVPPHARGGLSKEDADLWSRTVQSMEPLKGAKPRVTESKVERSPRQETQRPSLVRGPMPQRASTSASTSKAAPHSAAPPLARFDARKLRHIARGRTEIEARIDLHGLRQAEAHRRLRAFVLDAHARNLRAVLVITGKGGSGAERDQSGDERPGERGVIRRSVPLWLAEPELRAVVVSFTTAHARHGGEGALYVHLRRRRVRGT